MFDINYQEEHEADFHQKSKCQYCKKEFPASDLNKHQNNCDMQTQFC